MIKKNSSIMIKKLLQSILLGIKKTKSLKHFEIRF